MELKIEDLKVGDELECIDRDGFINGQSPDVNKEILKHTIIISHFGEYGVYLTVDFWLEEEELKYFRKKPKLQFSDLKVGDYVYVRDSLEHGEKYGDRIFVDGMDGMIKGGFIEIHRKYTAWISNHGFDYTPEMLDLSRSMKKEDYLKMQEKEYSFDDLIDFARKSIKDGVILSIEITNIAFCIRLNDKSEKIFSIDSTTKVYVFIQSLYKEKFTIESEEDIDRIKKGAEITLPNGNKSKVSVVFSDKNAIKVDGWDYLLQFFALKGATVTQSK